MWCVVLGQWRVRDDTGWIDLVTVYVIMKLDMTKLNEKGKREAKGSFLNRSVSPLSQSGLTRQIIYTLSILKSRHYYPEAHSELRLVKHTSTHVENYLQDLGRNLRLSDWHLKQPVEDLRILFVDMVKPAAWAESFRWDF
jgi:hypothetical protein